MPYIGNITSDFSIDTGNITNRAVTATKLSPSSVGSNGQVLSVDGSGNLQWSADASGTALTGSTNNTITTVTGANAIQGEANLTFDGNDLIQTVAVDGKGLTFTAGDVKPMIIGNANRSSAGNTLFGISGKWNNNEVGRIAFEAGNDTTNKDDAKINFYTRISGSTLTSKMLIDINGNVGIGTTAPGTKLDVSGDIRVKSSGVYKAGHNGSESAPLYTVNDGDTGIFRGANANELAFATAANSRMLIDADGKVGIGTTSPNTRFTIVQSADDSTGGLAIFDSSASSSFRIFRTGAGAGSVVSLQDRGSDVINIKDELVGIGTTSPAAKLEITDTSTAQIRTGYNATKYARIGRASNGTYEFFSQENGAALVFGTAESSDGGGAEKMRIDRYGMIGLGNITPKTTNTFNAIELGSGGFIGSQTSAKTIEFASNAYYNSGWKYKHSSVAASQYYQYTGYHEFSTAASGTADNAITFTPLLRLNANGKVGIGTTSPAEKLEVNGKIKITGTGGDGINIENSGGTNAACINLKNTLTNYVKEYRIAVAGSDGAYATANSLFIRDQTSGALRFEIESGGTTAVSGALRIKKSGDTTMNIRDTSANAVSNWITSKTAGYAEYNCYKEGVGTKYPHVFVGYTEEYARIDSAGIKFNGDTASANGLNDYEEGTWTPAISPTSGSVTSYYNQEGAYTKIGRLVKCHYRLRVNNAGDASGNIMISGLPFTVGNTLFSTGLDGSGRPTYWTGQATNIVEMTMTPVGGETKAYIYCATGAATTLTNLTDSNAFGNGWDVRAELMYFV